MFGADAGLPGQVHLRRASLIDVAEQDQGNRCGVGELPVLNYKTFVKLSGETRLVRDGAANIETMDAGRLRTGGSAAKPRPPGATEIGRPLWSQ
jgi:hypothetical protein